MNQREPTSAPVGAGQALPCLALLLLLLTATRAGARSALTTLPAVVPGKPYLVALGAPPLRFEEPAPPPDLVTRPPAAAPPQPPSANEEIAATSAGPAPEAGSAAPADISLATAPTPGSPADSDTPPAATRTPPPILTDDVRPQTRPEDFLPFFQIPAPTGDATVIAPIPRSPSGPPLPGSSATYTQTPR